ncbi:GRAM domain-containing protein 2B-like [Grus americana]|uniref:GRAM domain-containing protein 2B-like n=1 Tax=Grus americana TaxID=9117 RepID=UPI0024079808|nr:GRAM domain-containing protein 2B-like [Grus americana]
MAALNNDGACARKQNGRRAAALEPSDWFLCECPTSRGRAANGGALPALAGPEPRSPARARSVPPRRCGREGRARPHPRGRAVGRSLGCPLIPAPEAPAGPSPPPAEVNPGAWGSCTMLLQRAVAREPPPGVGSPRGPGLGGTGSHPASPGLVFAPTPPCKPAAAGPSPACPPFLASGRRRRRQLRARDGSGRSGSGATAWAGRDVGGSAVSATSCLSDSSLMAGKLRRSGRGVMEEKRWQSLEERSSAGTHLGHPVLARSKTCDPSFCKETEQTATPAGRQEHPSLPLSKRAASYCKAFGELAEREALLACFSCAWQREVPYHGRLYISSRYVCFHSSLLLKDIKAVVPIASISAIKKTNTALLVPNALSIRTAEGEKFLFVSLHQREATYQLLKSVCKHLQDNSRSSLASPSTKEILSKSLTSSQLDPEQSTLEHDSLQESLDGPSPMPRQAEEEEEGEEAAALALSSGERAPLAKLHSFSGGPHIALWARTTVWLSPLNTVILIYLLLMVALLLSSGYIGLRIMELEQQLASVGALPGLNLSHQYKMT